MPDIKSKYKVDAGKLIHPIEIQRKTTSKPVNGIVEEVFETIYAPRCAVSNNTGKYYYQSGVELYDKISKAFVFRTHRTIEIKPQDIIIYNNERYEIISVFDYDDVGMFTKVIANRCE